MPERSCIDCRFAVWIRMKNGRINRHYAGKCVYQIDVDAFPKCVTDHPINKSMNLVRFSLDPVKPYENCPTWDV